MKPLGQQYEKVGDSLYVDKDVVLFKDHFALPLSYEKMSPVIFKKGYTRDFLDGLIDEKSLRAKIIDSWSFINSESDFTIVEGTGHMGVGAIVNLHNASVASLLDLEVVLIAKGGIGSAFDELALNKALCDQHGVKLRGVILNQVLDEKREMIETYFSKALQRWNIPFIGCIPYEKYLSTPAMGDFEVLFQTTLLAGERYHFHHFETMRLVATSVATFKERIFGNQLIVTPATREDIIQTLLEHPAYTLFERKGPEHGLILTGRHPPTPAIIEQLKEAAIPTLYAPYSSFEAMRMISSFTAKIRKDDLSKIQNAITLVESHLNFSYLEN